MDVFDIYNKVDTHPQPALGCFDEFIAFLATPIGKKLLGIEGWTETGYDGDGRGTLVRNAAHSTDGFWTVDLQLIFFRVLKLVKYSDFQQTYYLRLEIKPGTPAHDLVEKKAGLSKGQLLAFQGPILLDHDGSFLEVHPENIWLL